MKKYIIALLFVSLIVIPPIKESKAFVGALAAAAAWLSTPEGIALSTSVAIHATILAIKFFNDDASPTLETPAPLQIQLDPNTPLTNDSPPPQTVAAQTLYSNACGGTPFAGAFLSSPETACVQLGACAQDALRSNSGDQTRTLSASWNGSSCDVVRDGAYVGTSSLQTTVSCPPGYSGTTTCTLVDETQVTKPPDQSASVKRDNTGFHTDPRDPDVLPDNVQVNENYIEVTNEDGSKTRIAINSDGSAQITETTPNISSGTTSVRTTNISAPNGQSGGTQVTGQATQTYNGIGDAQSDTPTAGGGGTGSGDFNCPECAKETTLSNIKGLLSGDGASPETAGSSMPSNLDAVQNTAFNANSGVLQNYIGNSGILQLYQDKVLPLSPWALATAGESADCHFPFTAFHTTYQLSICEAQPYLHPALSFAFFILTALGCLNLIAERPDGGS